jgi:hypothetical protein
VVRGLGICLQAGCLLDMRQGSSRLLGICSLSLLCQSGLLTRTPSGIGSPEIIGLESILACMTLVRVCRRSGTRRSGTACGIASVRSPTARYCDNVGVLMHAWDLIHYNDSKVMVRWRHGYLLASRYILWVCCLHLLLHAVLLRGRAAVAVEQALRGRA